MAERDPERERWKTWWQRRRRDRATAPLTFFACVEFGAYGEIPEVLDRYGHAEVYFRGDQRPNLRGQICFAVGAAEYWYDVVGTPAPTDACRELDGTCDGSCLRARPHLAEWAALVTRAEYGIYTARDADDYGAHRDRIDGRRRPITAAELKQRREAER